MPLCAKHPRTPQPRLQLSSSCLSGAPFCIEPWDPPACTCFNVSYPTKTPSAQSPGISWLTYHLSSSCPTRALAAQSAPGHPSLHPLWLLLSCQGAFKHTEPLDMVACIPFNFSSCQGTHCTDSLVIPWPASTSAPVVSVQRALDTPS